jgi:hypothetical protein
MVPCHTKKSLIHSRRRIAMSPKTTVSQSKAPRTAARAGAAKAVAPAKKPAARKPPAKAAATSPGRARKSRTGLIRPEQRARFIAEAAYFRAAARNFSGGGELDDWLEAEAEIDALLNSRGAG